MKPSSLFRACPFRRLGVGALLLVLSPAALRAANAIRWDLLSVPSTAVGGGEITITAVVTNLGDAPWGGAHNLVMRDATDTPVAMTSLAGIEPGETRTLPFRYGLPSAAGTLAFSYQALEHEVEWFGETLPRTVAVAAPPAYTGMQLSATTFDRFEPARLATTDAVVNAPPYRLRAKVIDGTAWAWHAANAWNTNGLPLDNPPPAGAYATCSLYWVRYASLFGNVIEIGPERLVPLTVTGPVTLTANWFHAANPPLVFTGETMWGAASYRLFATFRNALGTRWETSDGPNNHRRPLTNLPPPGDYDVDLYWRKYDSAQRMIAAGPVRTVTVRVTEGPQLVLQGAGQIFGQEVYNDADGTYSMEYTSDFFAVHVAVPGVLRVRATAAYGSEMYLNVSAADGAPLRNGGRELEVPVSPGEYTVAVTAGEEDAYGVTGQLFPYAAKPVLTSPATVRSGAGAPLAGYAITASGEGPLRFGAPDAGADNGLPPGLTVDRATGVIAGTPTTPGVYPVWVTAANVAGSTGQWVTFTIFERPEPVLALEGATGPDSGVLALDWTGRLPATALPPHAGGPPPTGAVTYTAARLAPGAAEAQTLAVPAGLPASLTALYGELRVTAEYAGDANYAPSQRTVVFRVPDTQPPIPPPQLIFQPGVLTTTGFSVAWNAFTDASGQHGGWPSHGLVYEASLDGGAQVQVTTVPGAAFNGLAPGSTHSVRIRARDALGNWSGWHGTVFTATLPATEAVPGQASLWSDVNGDGIRDELIPVGERLSVFAAEERTETVSYTDWHWELVPQLGVSWRDGWNLFAGGSWQLVPEDVTYHVELMRPGFQFFAEPGYEYAVVWSTRGPSPDSTPRLVSLFPSAEYVPAGAGTGAVLQEVLAGSLLPTEAFHFFPTHLVRLGKPLGQLRLGGFAASPAASGGAAGVLRTVLGTGGTTLSLADAAGNLLKAGSRVAWEVWDGLGRLANGTALGGMIDLGLTTTGEFRVGLKLDDSSTVWLNLHVAPPPSGRLSGPSHLWINDDDDSGALGVNDIPNAGSPDYADQGFARGWVNGLRDLVDFFPVVLHLRDFLAVYPPSSGARYRLRQADGALNFAYSSLTSANASSYHSQILTTGFGDALNQAPGEAATHRITATGIELAGPFLARMAAGGDGVILVEGRGESTQPLELVIERPDGAPVASLSLPLRVSRVERMFRHLNLRDAVRSHDGRPEVPRDLGPLDREGDRGEAWPDALTNGRYLVFLHGYNVGAERARGWAAEVFKRFHQSGSRARFVAVSWYGSTGVDYHRAVFHAFQTGNVLAERLRRAGIAGDLTLVAHSLGNVVASQAIQDGGLAPSRYFMINAAVPLEAFDASAPTVPEAQRAAMTERKWVGFSPDLYASNWHRLFATNPADRRNQLTWKDRFSRVAEVAYNFYSPGEDVLSAPLSNSGSLIEYLWRSNAGYMHGVWALQELVKGAGVGESLAAIPLPRQQGGWGESVVYLLREQRSPDPRREPYFGYFKEKDLHHPDAGIASAKAAQELVQYDLLASGIPALSFAAALEPLRSPRIGGRNFDLETVGRRPGLWADDRPSTDPAGHGRWLHSDFRDVALPYVSPLYLQLINLGSLQ